MRSAISVLAISLSLAAFAPALNIVMNYDLGNSTEPPGDPGGIKLQVIMQEVENVYERIIKDAGTVTISYCYTPNTGGLANANFTSGAGGKPVAGTLMWISTLATATVAGQNLIGIYFEAGCAVTLTDADDRLCVFGAEVQPGAVFSGAGVLKNDWSLNLAAGASVGVKLTNGGTNLTIAGTARGSATVSEFLQWRAGNTRFDLGTSVTGNDLLNVTGTATLRGTCTVNITALGNGRWRIINAAVLDGTLSTLVQEGMNGGTATLEYFADGVDVVITDGQHLLDGIPGTLDPFSSGHRFPTIPVNARMSSSNSSVARIEGNRIVPVSPGTFTLQLETNGQTLTRIITAGAPLGTAGSPFLNFVYAGTG